MHVANNLLLMPRISQSVQATLDGPMRGSLQVAERQVSLGPEIEEIHQLLLLIMQACIDEVNVQLKLSQFKLGKQDIEEVFAIFKIDQALLDTFESSVKKVLEYTYLGPKIKLMIENIRKLRKLIWILLNQDCVTFFTTLNDIRCQEIGEGTS